MDNRSGGMYQMGFLANLADQVKKDRDNATMLTMHWREINDYVLYNPGQLFNETVIEIFNDIALFQAKIREKENEIKAE